MTDNVNKLNAVKWNLSKITRKSCRLVKWDFSKVEISPPFKTVIFK